jgi:hypothetical protein
MKPFLLTKHERDFPAIRELSVAEQQMVGGGCNSPDPTIGKSETVTVTAGGSSNDGCDAG